MQIPNPLLCVLKAVQQDQLGLLDLKDCQVAKGTEVKMVSQASQDVMDVLARPGSQDVMVSRQLL